MTQPMMTFNDGHSMPQMGAGIWQVPQDQTARVVREALEIGYRLIDGAKAYGNEEGLGQGLRDSGIPRDEVFVTTKLWNDAQGRDATLAAFDASMARLGLDMLDLYLIHWPVPTAGLYVETWKTLIELRDQGRIRSIGVANFNPDHLQRLIDETGVTPALNQIEIHPTLIQTDLRAANARMGIVTQSWTPLGRGDFQAPEIRSIAETHGRTPAQVVLRWHIQNGLSVIPKSDKRARLAENFAALDFTLTQADMDAIDMLDSGHRTGPDPMSFEKR